MYPPPPVPPVPAAPVGPPVHRPRRGAAVLTVVAVFMAGAGGVMVGRNLGVEASDSAPTSKPAAETQTVSTVPGPVAVDDMEPVASVAAALAPAVVQIETKSGLGSGFIYDESGLIMTAAHVVDGATAVNIRLGDGPRLDGTVLGSDDATDVAVVKVGGGSDLPVAVLAPGVDLQVGQTAVAIGSPFGLDQSVTAGIVSALGRSTQTPGGAIPAIQTDAPINSGNSGGALADRQGRIIGINDSIITGSQGTTGNVGIGFAIPIDIAKAVADKIVAGEEPTGGFLGVRGADGTGDRAGALITDVEPGTPADDAGLKVDDLVTALDERKVTSMIDLVARVTTQGPGETVKLTVVRAETEQTVAVTLGEPPER